MLIVEKIKKSRRLHNNQTIRDDSSDVKKKHKMPFVRVLRIIKLNWAREERGAEGGGKVTNFSDAGTYD